MSNVSESWSMPWQNLQKHLASRFGEGRIESGVGTGAATSLDFATSVSSWLAKAQSRALAASTPR